MKNDQSVSSMPEGQSEAIPARKSSLDTSRPVEPVRTEAPSAEPTIRVRKTNPTLLTRDDGSTFARGEVDATPAEFERWSRLRLVVRV